MNDYSVNLLSFCKLFRENTVDIPGGSVLDLSWADLRAAPGVPCLCPLFLVCTMLMTRCVMNPGRASGDPVLAPVGVLVLNPSDTVHLERLAVRHRMRRHFLFHSRLYAAADFFLAGPAVGAPMAVLCLEKLIALGARLVLVHGWCGSLVPELAAADVLVPTWGLPEEGTSRHYGAPRRPAPDSALAGELGDWLKMIDVPCCRGPVWTTDAPFRETRDKVVRYGIEGLVAVDMEYSALCAVAAFRSVRLAAAMLVSDELWRTPWTPLFGQKRFRALSGQLLDRLADFVLRAETRSHLED